MSTNWKRNIILFLAGQTLSLFGSFLVQYAIMWYITLETQSGVMMTIYIICGFLPTFFISPFAGVWADRYNRKMLIILADSLIAAATLVLGLLFLSGYEAQWLLFVVPALRAVGSGIQTPAVGAFIPQLVPEAQLTKVNAANGSIQALVMLIAPMVSASLLTVADIETIFFIDVLTAAVAVFVLLLFLSVPAHAKALGTSSISYFHDMRKGFRYIADHAYLKQFFGFCAFFFVMAAPVAFLTPLQVTRSFGTEVWRLTAIEITFSLGMMAGGGLMGLWGGFSNRIHTMALSSFLIGACTMALGLVPLFWIYLIFMGIAGVSMPLFNTPSTVLLQEKVEEDYLGRVFGVLGMLSSVMMPIGMLVFGPLSDYIRIEWLLVGTGLLMAVQAVFLLGSKVLIQEGKPSAQSDPKLSAGQTKTDVGSDY